MTTDRRAYFYALIAVFFWSTVATAFKISLRYLSTVELLMYASIFSSIILFTILFFQKKLSLLKIMKLKDFGHSALLGFLNPFLYYFILFKAYDLLPAQHAQPLNYTWPVMIVLLSSIFLGQKIRFKEITAIFVSFSGVITIATEGDILSFSFSEPLGVSLAVGSSIIWALFWIFNVKDKRDETLKLFLNFSFGALFITLYYFIFESVSLPHFKGLAGAFYAGMFEMGITFLFWMKAMKYAKRTALISNLVFLSPFISLIFISLFLGETILISTIVGLVLIIAGIGLQKVKV